MSKTSERGFTLLEMVCVLALIAMIAAVLLPFVPRQTSRSRLQAYALQAATLGQARSITPASATLPVPSDVASAASAMVF